MLRGTIWLLRYENDRAGGGVGSSKLCRIASGLQEKHLGLAQLPAILLFSSYCVQRSVPKLYRQFKFLSSG